MNILNRLTIKSLKLNKKRTIVTIIGIVLSTALICAVAGMITSFQGTLIKFAIEREGNYHTRFNNVPLNEAKYIENNQNIESYFITTNIGYSKITSDNEYKPYLYFMGFDEEALKSSGLRLTNGRMPQNDTEVVISDHLLSNGGLTLKIGDTITATMGKRTSEGVELNQNDYYLDETEAQKAEIFTETGVQKTYKIVGIIERPDALEGYSAPGYTVITGISTEKSSVNISVLYKDIKNYADYTKTICNTKKLTDCKYELSYNKELLRWSGASIEDNTWSMLYAIGAVVIGIILVTSIFVIKNSFSISITERIKQYGMLSSVGATSKQIKKNVLFEGFILGLIGIPLGILCGITAILILVWLINLILGEYLNGIKFIYSVPLIPILISILVGALTIFLSSIFSARKAAKISPIEAIRSSNDIKIKGKKLKTPKLIKKIFKIGGEISYKNLKRSRKKYRTTVISLVVSICIFIGLSSFIEYGFKMSNGYYNDVNYDFSFYSSSENKKEQFDKIINLNGVETYSILRNKVITYDIKYVSDFGKTFLQSGQNTAGITMFAVGDKAYKEYLKKLNLSMEDAEDKAIIIDGILNNTTEDGVKHNDKYFNLTKGDTLTGTIDEGATKISLKIAAVTEEVPMGLEFTYYDGGMMIVSDKTLDKYSDILTSGLYIKTNNYEDFNKSYKNLTQNDDTFKTVHSEDIRNYAKQMNAMVLVISIFLYGFIAVISLIGVTNIFNTITTNMNLRSKEFAMLKSVGMTTKEFNRMIRLESVFYGVKSLIIGIPIGLALSFLVYKSIGTGYETPFIWPLESILLSIIFVFIIVGITMKYSLNKINKQNIIETIRNDNI